MYTAAELAMLRATDASPLPGVDTPVGDLTTPTKTLASIPTSNTAPFFYYPPANVVYVKRPARHLPISVN
jgi:hypothetical protein